MGMLIHVCNLQEAGGLPVWGQPVVEAREYNSQLELHR